MKYKDLNSKKENPFLVDFFTAEIKKKGFSFVKLILTVFVFPFRGMLNKSLWASGNLEKMIAKRKFEEGYLFGLEKLSSLKVNDAKNVFWPAQYTNWWSVFEQTCSCALEINKNDSMAVLGELFKRGPEPKDGLGVSISCCKLACLAIKNGDLEPAWNYVERAIKSDDSYGYSYFLRAWLGVKLKRGQILDDLMVAIKSQPELEEHVFQDEIFKGSPNILNELKNRLPSKV